MAANLFDHPYAAVDKANNSNPDSEHNSDAVTNFKDSPRKVLVQENKGASLDILNQIAQSPDFSCLTSKNGLRENGFQIETNSSCDEMDIDTIESESKQDTKTLQESENVIVGEQEKENSDTSDTKTSKTFDKGNENIDEFDKDKENIVESDSKVSDEGNLDESTNEDKIIGETSEVQKEEANISDQKGDDDTKDAPVAPESDKGTEEMDVSLDDGDEHEEETDDADEGEVNGSLENSTELTSEIKTGIGNGIVVSVMKKRRGRRKKRKKSLWSKPSPYKMRRLNSGSPKRVSIEEPAENKDSKFSEDIDVNKDGKVHVSESGAQTEEDSSFKETSQSDGQDERLRSRRSRTPGKREGYLTGNELEELDSATERRYEKKKSLLLYQGRRASPGQIKPLTAHELEKYSAPLKQGWFREVVIRGVYDAATCTGVPKSRPCDIYYFPPVGNKIRSMVQIADWLAKHETSLTTDNFTFMRRAIGVDGECVRNAAAHGRTKASMDSLRRKFIVKNVNDTHVHDDNDGQFDKPEIVIERDSDDFLAPIMSAVEKESTGSTFDPEPKRGRPKRLSNIPNLEELKEEKVETMHPSNEEVIISPPVKKEKHKATARKSTTQKTFRKSMPYTGIENLCSLTCPGMEGIPPMLHCNVCMCLFHNECVNYYEEDSDFVCLRCKQPPSAGGAPLVKIQEDSIMKVSNPALLSQLQKKPATTHQSIVRVFPNISMNPVSSSPGLITPVTFQQARTQPNSMLPLYKMLPVLSGSPESTVISSSSPYNYPVLLTKNTSAFKVTSSTSPSNASPSNTSPVIRSVKVPIVARKSPALTDIVNLKPKPEFAEIRPHIKQEPIDDSYQDAIKGNKPTNKRETNTKASIEALDNLKHVLSARLGSPPSVDKDITNQKTKKGVPISSLLNPQSFATGSPQVRMMTSLFNNINTNSPIAISQNLNQPRMTFNMASPPPGQYPPNQEYRIVPIGPPVPLNKLTARMPLLGGQNLMPMPIRPLTISPQIRPEKPVPLNIVTTQEDAAGQGNSGPLVVNAKSITPMNGQLLTLPQPLVRKLTLNKPLALKINNRQITVPPSGFFPSTEGLKIFLPPNTFPTAEDGDNDVTVSNEKTDDEESVPVSKSEKSSAIEKSSAESQPSAKADVDPKENLNKTDGELKGKNEVVTSANKMDIKRNKFYGKCCFIQKLYGGYDCMFHIFKHLELIDLVRLSEVCKAWRRILLLPDFWREVRFSDTKVSDWGKALKYVSKRDVQSINLKGLSHYEEPNRTWHQLVSSLHEQFEDFHMLKKISFGLVPAAVLQSVVGRLKHLQSFIAESISDFTDDSMWTVPTKIDVGNFRCTAQLRELKLRGTGGLSLPSFSFGCGLADIGRLTTLHTLHLTSLRNLKGTDFNFISNLTKLKELALGDCENWTQETYAHLEKLTSVERLRLENGGDIPDIGLGLALSHLTELERLELIKYTVAYTFGNHIGELHKLRHLCIFPLNLNFMGEVNTNTCRAVESLKDLKTLEWIIAQSSDSSIILDDNSNSSSDNCPEGKQQWIPFQTLLNANPSDSVKNSAVQYTSVDQLKSKLETALPNTKVSVYCAKSERRLI
ncbi:uncharacterized protein LOC132740334 isoform X2 [Ruditapes philippinarum]|uniref:uncharacterized protein LOC132740334 isoform X2 n=1 Tax=Ruditapes philippinarum TaxID=129788 RepID=UPI00295BD50B|nr:uncharacterized protein LOC132740334 isoform X2 [Ruditapes philippinarum]